MRKKITLTAMAVVIAMTFFACKGDQGAMGPAGANGANGVSGLTVTNQTITPGNWSAFGSSGVYWSANTSVSTSPSNVVEAYYSYDNTSFYSLPSTNVFYVGDNLSFAYANGASVTLVYYNGNQNAPSSTIYVNVAVIPSAQVAKMKLLNVNLKDYNQVNAYIKLFSK